MLRRCSIRIGMLMLASQLSGCFFVYSPPSARAPNSVDNPSFEDVRRHLETQPGYRALARADDARTDRRVYGRSWGRVSQDAADAAALALCHEQRRRSALQGDCFIYPTMPAPDAGNFASIVAVTQTSKAYRAVARAYDSDSVWAAGYAHGRSTQDEADRSALQHCSTRREQHGVHAACSLYPLTSHLPAQR